MLSLDDSLRRRPDVVSQSVAAGAVLVDMASGRCFELNVVGAHFWRLLERPASLRQVREELLAQFSVSPEVLEPDMFRLAEELLQAGLVQTAPNAQSPLPPRTVLP